MRITVRALVTIMMFCAYAGASDTEAKKEPTPAQPLAPQTTQSPEVKTVPPAGEFLLIPLRVYRLKSTTFAAADCSLTDGDLERIIGKVNRVWAHAGIRFVVDSITEETADAERLLKLPGMLPEKNVEVESDAKPAAVKPAKNDAKLETAEKPAEPKAARFFKALIPNSTRRFDGFRVYYIHDFDVNGIYYGNRETIVKETASLRKVPGGIDEPLPRVTAHELGHGLGLPHRQDRINLMQSGTTGTSLNEAEIATARKTAIATPGMIRYADLDKAIENEQDATRRERLERWKKETAASFEAVR